MDTTFSPITRQTWLEHLWASRLCVKVCGMRDPDNIAEIAQLQPNMMGFIFYPPSPRFMGDTLSPSIVRSLPPSIVRVGVFVNAALSTVLAQVERFGLHAVQLHGDETSVYTQELRQERPELLISKAVGIFAGFSFNSLFSFEESCDYFVFDTKTPQYGGSGQTFDWSLLTHYRRSVPYLLSGGLGLSHMTEVCSLPAISPGLLGVDLNSRVEERPGRKSPAMVQQCLAWVRGESQP